MKKLILLFTIVLTGFTTLQAQAPQGFNYQATVRNSDGGLLISQNVYFKFNVMQGSQTSLPVFTETHYVPTDDLGQVNFVIGEGTASEGDFTLIDWSLGSYFLGIELNTDAGYVAMGTTQLLSVPYALYAESSGGVASSTPNLETVLAVNNSANSQQIKNLQDPTEAQDAVTKSYMETLIADLQAQIDDLVADETPVSTIPTEGLLAYYPLDGNGNDESSFNNNLITNGTVDFVAGFDGTQNSAANFTNSLAGYLEMPSSSYGHINSLANGSVSFWIKLDSKFVSNHYFNFGNSFMVKQKHGVGQDLFIGLKDDTTQVMVHLTGTFPTAESNYIVGATALELDTWYNLTNVWEGDQNKLYINGVLDGEVTVSNQGIPDRTDVDFFSLGTVTYGTNTGTAGESDAGAYGSMDNICFWNRVLTGDEILGLYSSN